MGPVRAPRCFYSLRGEGPKFQGIVLARCIITEGKWEMPMFRVLFNGLSAAQDSEHLYLINFLLSFLDFGIFSSNKIKHCYRCGVSRVHTLGTQNLNPLRPKSNVRGLSFVFKQQHIPSSVS